MINLSGKRAVVMGLGRFGGGVGVARFLHEQGAAVLVTDTLPADRLKESTAQLAHLPRVTFRLGGHRQADFAVADLVVVNPAVRPGRNPCLQAARQAGAIITSEIRLLVERLPNRRRVIAVTGTAGKSTVSAMLGHILGKQAHAGRITGVHVGGNLGGSLLTSLDNIGPDDWIVLELSSFMLERLKEDRWSPHVAVMTNLAPNHLDWHGSYEAYVAAKQVLFDYQNQQDVAVVRQQDADHHFALDPSRWPDRIICIDDQAPARFADRPLLVPGEHNRLDAVFAVSAAHFAGVASDVAWAALADFPGLPHRLQLVCEYQQVRFFNDSKSTTPGAAMLAIGSFDPETVHVILGGYDKGSDLAALAAHAASRCRGIYTIGVTGPTIASQAAAANPSARIIQADRLDRALDEAVLRVRRGDVVLLSPGCASWDQFDNFEQRGNAFAQTILSWTTQTSMGPDQAPGAADG